MKKTLVLAFIIIAAATSASALTWSEAVALAEQKNSQLINAAKDLESAEWSYKKSWSTFLPHVSASGGLSETASATSGAWSRSYSYGLSVSQSLYQGMAGIYGIQSAYKDVEYRQASLAATKASVLYDLRSSFLAVMVAQENVKLLEQILKQRRENASLIQLRYNSGKEDKGNLMTTRADEAKAEYDLSSAKRDLKLARLKLSQLLKYNVDQVELKAWDTGLPQQKIDLDQLVRTSPTYVMAKKQLESQNFCRLFPCPAATGGQGLTGRQPDLINPGASMFPCLYFPEAAISLTGPSTASSWTRPGRTTLTRSIP